jgi:hypothetical protein
MMPKGESGWSRCWTAHAYQQATACIFFVSESLWCKPLLFFLSSTKACSCRCSRWFRCHGGITSKRYFGSSAQHLA